MNWLRLSALTTCLLAAFTFVVRAQVDCPTLVKTALETADRHCSTTGRNQACYGNIFLEAQPQVGVTDLHLSQPGDTTGVAGIKSLRLSSLDLTTQQWGVAIMRIQANLPDTSPGQNVTFLLFGDVQIDSKVSNEPQPILVAATTTNVNVRARPSKSASVLSSLAAGQTVTIDGRLSNDSWMHVHLADQDIAGWVLANLLTITGNTATLPFIDPTAPTFTFGAMQAFYFKTGVGDRPCEQAPDSGILIQTPQGAGTIQLQANEVDITLGSTAYLQAGKGFMTVSVVEGAATVSVQGTQQRVPAGTYTQIPLDASGVASGTPTYPKPYDYAALKTLPVQIALPKVITVATPVPVAEVAAAVSASAGQGTTGQPSNGRWANTDTVGENTCDPSRLPPGNVTTAYPTFTFSDNRSSFVLDWGNGNTHTFVQIGESTYTNTTKQDPRENWTIIFTSSTTYSSTLRGDYGTCVYAQTGSGRYVG